MLLLSSGWKMEEASAFYACALDKMESLIFIVITMRNNQCPHRPSPSEHPSSKSLKSSFGIQRSVLVSSLVTIIIKENVASKCEWNSVPLSVTL
jgi:hypothetical protein